MSINLRDLTKTIIKEQSNRREAFEAIASKDIAIIGIACRIASSNNKDEYWQILKRGEDCIRELPKNRQKMNEPFLKARGNDLQEDGYFRGGFLQEIDKFDFELFNISPLEANLMSPHQRNFLETALSAIEDAGYGGKRIAGSKTGVFLGHSTDFTVSYKEFIETLNPSLAGLAISGNLNSVIASRICYLLDLKGPSMVVDTACSSALVAVHMACLSLRKRECSMALAGAVTIDLLPLKSIKSKEDELGTTSPDGITRAFDDDAQGMGPGEGVGALLLKPLSKALEDGDNIYAIIKGSAINQDGNSVNLTAPNPAAQAEVIVKAWQEAGINPETITYIEAHGTGTELGDPIEIDGIEKAFNRYTNRKQFCGIGSVKTNVGHLDHSAGLAGLFKAVLALKNKEIPPSLHFRRPNKKISFEDTPIYVNDIHREWKASETPRRCGVSSFGLSGTNCHVVLEEAPEAETRSSEVPGGRAHVLALSAKSREGILELIWQYQLFFERQKDIDLNNVCYTANTGRGHYNCRLAIIFKDLNELLIKLEKSAVLEKSVLVHHGILYGEHKIISEKQGSREIGEITQSQQINDTKQANKDLNEYLQESDNINVEMMYKICEKYVSGSDIEWGLLYKDTNYKRVSLPGYPFLGKSCWVEAGSESMANKLPRHKEIEHPLLERCIADSFDQIIYSSVFDVNNYWILNEHKVAGAFVVPGTTYLEMVTEILRLHYSGWDFHLKDVVFISPLALNEKETVEVHSVIKNEPDGLAFTIASKPVHGNDWNTHAEGKVRLLVHKDEGRLDIENRKQTYREGTLETFEYEQGKGIETGPRWKCVQKTYIGMNELMAQLSVQEEYVDEIKQYNLHPALMDEAVNIALRSIGKGLYLPFSYKSMVVMGRLPGKIYSYIKRRNADRTNNEFASFDIILTDDTGKKVVQIEDYTIKKVGESKIRAKNSANAICYSEIVWNKKQNESHSSIAYDQNVIVFKGEGTLNDTIVSALRRISGKVVEIEIGSAFEVVSEEKMYICPEEEDYLKVFQHKNINDVHKIIYLHALSNSKEIKTIEDLKEEQKKGVYGLFNLVKALVKNRIERDLELVLIAQYANEVDRQQKSIIPGNAALFGFAKAINLEYPKIKCRSIDIDDYTQADTIVSELSSLSHNDLTAYRHNQRFVPYLESIDISSVQDYKFSIREKGVYTITGGTGGIGIEVAKFLSSMAHVNIALINRSPFLPAEKWEQIIEAGDDTKLCNKIHILNEIKQNGSNIVFYDADVSSRGRMEEVFNDLRRKFGHINGIFHAAGNAGDGFIINRSINAFRNVLAPKVAGTWILDKLTQEENLDFFVLFSSVSSIVAEAGQADYAAASSYLNAYSVSNRREGARYITINWPAWTEVGMAVDYGVDFTKEVFSSITTDKAIEALDELLKKDIRNIIIGDVNYSNYINKCLNAFDLTPQLIAKMADKKSSLQMHNHREASSPAFNVILTGAKNEEAYTESERQVANIVGNALGLREVDIYKGFLELGGNSIIAIKVELDMEKVGMPLSLLDLYEYKTIKELAEFLSTKYKKGERTENKSITNFEKTLTREENKELAASINLNSASGLILNNIKPFNEVFYKTCFHNSLLPVLGHFNVSLAPILANDIFVYDFFNKDKETYEDQMMNIYEKTIQALLNDLGIVINVKKHVCSRDRDFLPPDADIYVLKQTSECIGIKPQEDENNITDLLSDVKKALTKRRPVIIWVDCFYLSGRKDTYKKEHWMHTLLLYGFDEAREIFFAVEHSFKGNLTYKEQEISFKDVMDSYEGYLANYMCCAEMPTFYEFFSIPQSQISPNYKDIYRINLQKCKDKIVSGFENLKLGVDKISEIVASEQNLKENIDYLIDVLNGIISAKQVEKYIVSILFDDVPEFDEAAKKVLDTWTYIRQIIVKYKYSSVYNSAKIMSLIQRMNEIYPTERRYYDELFARLLVE